MRRIFSWHDAITFGRECKEPSIVSIGTYDGVHLGHRFVIEALHARAAAIKAESGEKPQVGLITFSEHPRRVIDPYFEPQLLTPLPLRLDLLEAMNLDFCHVVEFTPQLSRLTAEEFLRELKSAYHLRHLILGSDGSIGRDRKGFASGLDSVAHAHGVDVEFIHKLEIDGNPVSSSRIRSSLRIGQLEEAQRFLGRPHSIYGEVVRGRRVGASQLGVPTANIAMDNLCLPPLGVYAVLTKLSSGEVYPSIANIGRAPSMHPSRVVQCEVHLLDQDLDLRGEYVDAQIHHFLRPELAFKSIDLLKQQIHRDLEQARHYWAKGFSQENFSQENFSQENFSQERFSQERFSQE